MQLTQLFLAATLSLGALAREARPSPTSIPPITPPPPHQSYAVGYPLCEIRGYTTVPGLYNETTHQQTGATLKCCMDDCRTAYPACKSIAFHARYTLCLFFDDVVENTQLWTVSSSEFVHYDLDCHDAR